MKRLLFIRYKKSKSILEGGEQGSQKNYNVLSHILGEENINTYYIHDENKSKHIGDYMGGVFHFLQNYYFGLSKARVREIVALSREYDYVFIDRSVFGILAKALKKSGYKGEIICFFHNVETVYFKAKIPRFTPWRPLVLRCVDVNDRYCCRYADKIIALNKRDDQELFSRYGRRADVLIPVAMKDRYQKSEYTEEKTNKSPHCFFLGTYFPANSEGILWFVENVYPHVDINLFIVGKGMSQLKAGYNFPPGIEIVSDVPDLTPYFETADIMILPIFSGSGMKVKTCESLMYGKNIVATSEAFEGYELDYDKVGGLCDTKDDFIQKIREFEKTPRPKFNPYSRRMFLEKYSEEAVFGLFEKILK